MWATFCDDVRQEVGNKLSYLGIYGPNLIVPGYPTTLVKLCCVFSLRVPANAAPQHVQFKLVRDEEVLFEASLRQSDLTDSKLSAAGEAPDDMALTIASIAQLVGFPITQRCLLKSRAIVDGRELRGGTLELTANETRPA
jgi:hypothetical protein